VTFPLLDDWFIREHEGEVGGLARAGAPDPAMD
jgi:hypothetical protein